MNKYLPKDWITSSIEEICTHPQYGYTTKAVSEGNIKLLRTTDITSGKIDWSTVPYCKEDPQDPEKYLLRDGDIVISRAGSVGFSYLIQKPENSIFASYLIRFNPLINKNLFKYFLESPFYWNSISEKKLGIAIPNVNATKIKSIKLNIPPPPEQRAIVTKIEQLFNDLDNGIENFKKAQEQLKIYRQAVLKNACEGKLVSTEAELARAEERNYEPADVLLVRILKERREKWNGKGKYKEPASPDTNGLSELPEGWKWVSIDQISNLVTDGDHNPPKRVVSGIPHLTAKNIKNWQISEEGCTYIIEQDFEKVRKRYLPIRGDIIITCVGTIGRTTIVPENYIFSADRNLAVVRLISEGLTEKLMQFYLNTSAAQNSMSTASGSTAQPHLYLGKIRVFPVPLPPLAEQRRIVVEVERRLLISDKMEVTIAESLQKAESLRQSILKKAFEGKLLNEKELEEARYAPDWEPAEKLLEKIKAKKKGEK